MWSEKDLLKAQLANKKSFFNYSLFDCGLNFGHISKFLIGWIVQNSKSVYMRLPNPLDHILHSEVLIPLKILSHKTERGQRKNQKKKSNNCTPYPTANLDIN